MDFAGPIKYLAGPNNERKAYIILWACSLTRAIDLELLTNLSAENFILALKRFIARRGRFKVCIFKAVGGGKLTWDELTKVLLDIETQLNRRPLGYVEDDIGMPLLTPATFLYSRSTEIPTEPVHQITEVDLYKRAKFLKRSKEQLWNR